MIGRTFRRLTARDRVDAVIGLGARTRGAAYLCACRCGVLVVARGADLRAHKVTSCGCVARRKRSEQRTRTFEPPTPRGTTEALALVALHALAGHDVMLRVQDIEQIAAVAHVTAWRALTTLHRRRMARRPRRPGPGSPAGYVLAPRGARWLVALRLGEVRSAWADEARRRSERIRARTLRIMAPAISTPRRRAA